MKSKLPCYLLVTLMICSTVTFSQEVKEPNKTEGPESAMMALAKASQNPVADMNTVPFQFNWFTGGGFGDMTMSQTLIQPVLPLPISKDFNLVSRTIVPVLSIPAASGEKLKGIADIQEQIFLSPSKPKGIIWGFGPVLSFPTTTISSIATGQFALGPTAIALVTPGKFVLGAVGNQMWRITGSKTTSPISSFFVQPFINYNFKMGWSIITAPSITANWSAADGQRWTVPIGLGVSKITVVGKQPFSLSLQYYHNAMRPDNAGDDQVRMAVALLFPR